MNKTLARLLILGLAVALPAGAVAQSNTPAAPSKPAAASADTAKPHAKKHARKSSKKHAAKKTTEAAPEKNN